MVSTERLRQLIDEELADLIEIRHDLHAHPELGYEERRTSGVVVEQLERAGIPHAGDLAGGTGVMGHLPAASADDEAPAVGLRADMDALPIHEQTGLDYASTTPGTMHACGHDGHTTILLGAARVLKRIADETPLPHPVTFVFQPAEEGGAGAKRMIEDGCLDGSTLGPPVARMFGLHGWPRLPLGSVGSIPGPMLAAADLLEITVRGTGSHAAFPQVSADPVVAASAIVTALQTICSRNVDPLDSIVVSVTCIHGGAAHNVIPDSIELGGTVRTLLPETQALAQRRIREIAEGVAAGLGCVAEVRYELGYPVTRNDETMHNVFNAVATETFGADRLRPLENPVMGGEDFSFYCHQVPSCFFALGLIPPGRTWDQIPQLHQPTFDFNDEAIPVGVEAFCRLAMR